MTRDEFESALKTLRTECGPDGFRIADDIEKQDATTAVLELAIALLHMEG